MLRKICVIFFSFLFHPIAVNDNPCLCMMCLSHMTHWGDKFVQYKIYHCYIKDNWFDTYLIWTKLLISACKRIIQNSMSVVDLVKLQLYTKYPHISLCKMHLAFLFVKTKNVYLVYPANSFYQNTDLIMSRE